ncbi:MAG: FIST N-terminal domain-containing protein, partial [Archangium sp.]
MARVKMQTARTTQSDPVAAAEDLLRQLQGGETPRLVTLFASRDRDQAALNRAVRERLPKGTRLVGATTAGELDNRGIYSGSVVLGALSGDFEVGLGLGTGLSVDAVGAGATAMKRAAQDLGVRQSDIDSRQYVGLVIDDGFRYKKEELLLGILDKNQTLVLVGGGAADHEPDPARQSALLHVDGEVATDAVLVALFKTNAPWAALRSHWYLPTD